MTRHQINRHHVPAPDWKAEMQRVRLELPPEPPSIGEQITRAGALIAEAIKRLAGK